MCAYGFEDGCGKDGNTWIRRESDTILRKMAENRGFIAKAFAAVDRF